jgi:hypothetical protein
MLSLEPRWIEINVDGENTGKKYFGKFQVKPFLKVKEKAEAVRLAERYMLGIETTISQREFLTTLALVTYHIVSDDSVEWWKEKGLDLYDEAPIYAIASEIKKMQTPPEQEKTNKNT